MIGRTVVGAPVRTVLSKEADESGAASHPKCGSVAEGPPVKNAFMMQSTLALNVPQSGRTFSPFRVALVDVIAGMLAVDIWGRLGWRETKRRYRRTVFGPFWTTVGLALFVTCLGLVWANLWNRDPKVYLPYLTSGMLCWVMFSTICMDGCVTFIVAEKLLRQLRISYTLLACANVWRNAVLFFHNLTIYVLVCIYAGLGIKWPMLLVIPGFLLFSLNAVWISIFLGAMCARYRDVQQLVGTLLQISLFLTPIFWSPDQLTGRTAVLAQLNPMYHLVAVIREPLLGKAPELSHWLVVGLITVVGWTLTIQMLTKIRQRIVYWL
jgi:ABC-type polysaccharide/polyol phosphate export permease